MDLTDLIQLQGEHSIFSPSSSSMWMGCPGSLIRNLLEPSASGYEAAEGTVAHAIAEHWLTHDRRPDHLVGDIDVIQDGDLIFEVPITEKMLDYVEGYVNWCAYEPGQHFIERRVDLSYLFPIDGQGGTADHIILQDRKLIVTDLKYGSGVQVYAHRNSQMMLYASGAMRQYASVEAMDEIEVRVAQPRLGHFDTWCFPVSELLEFEDAVRDAALVAWDHSAPLRPSPDACRWCSHRHKCPALLVDLMALLSGRFDELGAEVSPEAAEDAVNQLRSGDRWELKIVDVESLTLDDMARIYPYRRMVENFLKAVEDHLEAKLLEGCEAEGVKMVRGRSSRRYNCSEEAVIENMELLFGVDNPDELVNKKLKSPNQMEDLMRHKGFKGAQTRDLMSCFVVKSEGKPVIALESDKRPALEFGDAGAFEDLGGDAEEGAFEDLDA